MIVLRIVQQLSDDSIIIGHGIVAHECFRRKGTDV